jgi:RNA 2',3'-cyclic 3'-phosphodiesterase
MPRLRTFIAVPINETVRKKAVALQQQLAQLGSKVKWVEPENLHVTMLFLGEVDQREILEVCKAVEKTAANLPPFSMTVAEVGGFPNLRRPRTLWIGVSEGSAELVRLHDDLEKALLQLGGYRREERGFTPHITLGRVRGDELTPELNAALTHNASWVGGAVAVAEVHVMSSELTAAGPAYTVLSRPKLHGPADSLK